MYRLIWTVGGKLQIEDFDCILDAIFFKKRLADCGIESEPLRWFNPEAVA